MTDQRLTQCPHCKASFKVSDDQIKAANGRVRCGSCMNIFDAIAYSISKVTQSKKSVKSPPPPSADSPPVELEESILADQGDADLFEDNPEEDKADTGYSGDAQLSDEFSTSFLELDKNTDSTPDPYSTSFREMEPRTVEDHAKENSIDESWAEDILDDVKPVQEEKIEANAVSPAHSNAQISSTPSDSSNTSSPRAEREDYHELGFDYQLDSDPSDKKWIGTTIFSILNAILLATLIAQAGWFHYEKLARYPVVKQLFISACSKLKCTIPKLEDINKIKSQNLVVRSHPTTSKALIIDTIIINDAKFDQDFPDIALYFSDINKQVVAQRLIRPHEYLSGDLTSWSTMPSQQPIHVSLEIIDPGSNAVNYSIRFYLRKNANLDS